MAKVGPSCSVCVPIQAINGSMLIFVIGVGLAGVATGVRYLTQLSYGSRQRTLGHGLNGLSNLLAVGSFSAFFWGGYKAFLAFGG